MANTIRDLHKRLLRLYPIKIVKEHFEQTGNAVDVIEAITGDGSQQVVRNFAFDKYSYTKQHIYIYDLDLNFSLDRMDGFPLEIVTTKNEGNGVFKFLCFGKVTYNVILNNPLESTTLKFFQPILIVATKKSLQIHFTKLEKNVSSFFDEDRAAIRTSQTNNEAEILQEIITHFNEHYALTPTDINKGIKNLWDKDFIDCKKVQWRRNNSVAMETMDEQYLYKSENPVDYKETVKKPLVKTSFKYLKEDEYFCDDFDADPGVGQLNIPKFPKNENQINNVITEILSRN